MTVLCFDIESGCEPDDVLETLFTFDETKVTNYHLLTKEFDPSAVKVGNMKDANKIAAKIEAAREKFTADKEAVTETVETKRTEAWQQFKDKAALSPLTGRVLAIGRWDISTPDSFVDSVNDDANPVAEQAVIEHFLSLADAVLSDGGVLVGHNIIAFDLPFLLRRGLKYGIRPPKTITSALAQYRPANLIDTMREWQFGNRYEGFVSLDSLAAFFGTQRKTGKGADFHKKFFGTPEERQEAIAYCNNDVVMTAAVAAKMGLIAKPATKEPEPAKDKGKDESDTPLLDTADIAKEPDATETAPQASEPSAKPQDDIY